MQNALNVLSNRDQLVELVRKWAEVNTDGILDKTTLIFSVDHIEGLIGYRIEVGNAVVYGDPVCAEDDKIALAKEFESYCKKQKIGVIYLIVSEEFAHLAHAYLSCSIMEFGRKFILNPSSYMENSTALLRKKIRQSSRNGVEIREYVSDNIQIEKEIEQVAISWVQARRGIQIYLAEPTLFEDRLGKRWFYAKHEEKIVGFVLLNELKSQKGWLLNNVMVIKGAPSGVSEHLVIAALESLQKEQCNYVLIGPVPAKQLGKMLGFAKPITFLADLAFKAIKKVCKLDGHEVFWEKFQPELKSSYILFPKRQFKPSSILALLRALNISLR